MAQDTTRALIHPQAMCINVEDHHLWVVGREDVTKICDHSLSYRLDAEASFQSAGPSDLTFQLPFPLCRLVSACCLPYPRGQLSL